MTDTRKEFEATFEELLKENIGANAYERMYIAWQACQQLNDKRIADLEATIRNMAAVIERKDEALQIAIEYQEEACQYFHDAMAGYKEHQHQRYRDDLKETKEALALTADGVELVEYAEIWNHGDGKTGIEYKNDLRKGDMIHGTKLYTIKQKD